MQTHPRGLAEVGDLYESSKATILQLYQNSTFSNFVHIAQSLLTTTFEREENVEVSDLPDDRQSVFQHREVEDQHTTIVKFKPQPSSSEECDNQTQPFIGPGTKGATPFQAGARDLGAGRSPPDEEAPQNERDEI